MNRTNALLTILTQIKALRHTQQLHANAIVHGLEEEVVLGSSLTNSYIQSNRLDLATASFDRIPPRKRNRYSWNTILSGYSKSKNHCESLRLYNRMRRDCDGVVDSFNLVFAIKACVGLGVLENGVLIHGLSMKNGLDKDAYVSPSLVEMYGELGRMEDAQKVFDEITLRSSVLWGVLMKGYLRYSRDSEVFRLFYLMREAGLGVDNALTLICLVKACGNVFAGKEGKSVHGLSIRGGFIDQSGYLQASVVDMYVKCRLLDNAREMFETSVDKNVVMWTTLVSGFAKCERAVEAFDLFRQMLRESVLPNQCTLAALLVSCSSLGSQRHGRSVHGYMIRNEIEMDAVNFTSFIDMYARCGNIRMARKVFDMMPERNVISWSSMINAFGINGMLEEALDCFGKMKSRNLTPNSVTYVSLLSACSHSGNIKEGRKQFASMTSDYRIAPEEEHYACMVDLLGRAGEVGEAKSFINNMPVKPMASAWGALLNACRIHKKIDLAEEIAEKLLSMGSNESSVYVLLSNIYADAGMWEMVNSVRSKMGMKGYTKPMGLIQVPNHFTAHPHGFFKSASKQVVDKLHHLILCRFTSPSQWFNDVNSSEISDKCENILKLLSNNHGCEVKQVVEIVVPELEEMRAAHVVSIGSAALRSLTPYCEAGRRLMEYHLDIFKNVDVIVTPTTGMTAPVIPPDALKNGETNFQVTAYLMRFVVAANLLGFLAISVPVGYDKEGLPIGLQIMGRPWAEATVLALAAAVEELAPVTKKPAVFHDVLNTNRVHTDLPEK
uniref:Amidase domain-containing protein n=1 Tax=Brassica campestris TaxID=3711 RepID=M4E695_BRACM